MFDNKSKPDPDALKSIPTEGEPETTAAPPPEQPQPANMLEPITRVKMALQGTLGRDQLQIALEGVKWIDTILRKNTDYGGSVWRQPFLAPKADISEAIFVRMSDKIERIRQLRSKGTPEVAESLEDTIADLGSYCLLWLARPQEHENDDTQKG